jgi:hypothetical protein
MRYRIWQFDWHSVPRDERFEAMRGRPLSWGRYKLVATIHASDLEDAFRRTQSLDGPWYAAAETVFTPSRSVCVGDVIEDAHGSRHVVQACGFAPYAPPV